MITCESCGTDAAEMPAAAWWAGVPTEDAVCCETVLGGAA